MPPSGTTAESPQSCARGTLRFNTDVGTLEGFRGDTIGWEYIEKREGQYLGDTIYETDNGSVSGNGTRMCIVGGYSGPVLDTIDYITISTLGDAEDFGDLAAGTYSGGAIGNSPRGFKLGGYSPGISNAVHVFTFASKGDAVDDVNLAAVTAYPGEFSNEIRGVLAGNSHPGATNVIQFIELALNNDGLDFGDLSVVVYSSSATSNGIRGVFSGNNNGAAPQADIIDFITIASKGDAQDFGNLSRATSASEDNNSMAATSNSIRGLFAGGYLNAPTIVNNIDFITIATIGNSSDFGDLLTARRTFDGCSDSHGGIGE